MDTQLFTNFTSATLIADAEPTDTEFLIDDSSDFPEPGAGEFFILVVYSVVSDHEINREVVKVTSNDTGLNELTVVRAQEGTVALSRDIGDILELRNTAGTLQTLSTNLSGAVHSVYGRTGDVAAESGDYTSTKVTNSSTAPGASVTDALTDLQTNKQDVAPLGTAAFKDVGVTASNVAAGNAPQAAIDGHTGAAFPHASDKITNQSAVAGSSVTDALDALDGGKTDAADLGTAAFKDVGTAPSQVAAGDAPANAVTGHTLDYDHTKFVVNPMNQTLDAGTQRIEFESVGGDQVGGVGSYGTDALLLLGTKNPADINDPAKYHQVAVQAALSSVGGYTGLKLQSPGINAGQPLCSGLDGATVVGTVEQTAAWRETASDAGTVDLGTGTGTLSWTPIPTLTMTVPQDVAPTDTLVVGFYMNIRNKTTDQSGNVDIGYGVGASTPTTPYTFPIPEAYHDPVAGNIIATGLTLAAGEVIKIYARVAAGSSVAYGLYVDPAKGQSLAEAWVPGATGASAFIDLTDTEADYVGHQGKLVKVNATEDGLIFGDPSGTSVSWGSILGDIATQTDLNDELVALQGSIDTHKTSDDHDGRYYTETEVDLALTGKEPVISPKNSAFNKAFGTGITDVARGDHNHDSTYAPAAHPSETDNPHNVTKAQVGLGNVDNTADADKPVSTATQTALDAKVAKAGDTLTGMLIGPEFNAVHTPLPYVPVGDEVGGHGLESSDDADLKGGLVLARDPGDNVTEVAVGTVSETMGLRLRASYTYIDTSSLLVAVPGAALGSRLICSGTNVRGDAVVGWERAPEPDYTVDDTDTRNFQIGSTDITGPWVDVCTLPTLTEDCPAVLTTVAYQMYCANPNAKVTAVEVGIKLDGVDPTAWNRHQLGTTSTGVLVSAVFNPDIDLTIGQDLILVIRHVGTHPSSSSWVEGTITGPSVFTLSRAATGGGGGGETNNGVNLAGGDVQVYQGMSGFNLAFRPFGNAGAIEWTNNADVLEASLAPMTTVGVSGGLAKGVYHFITANNVIGTLPLSSGLTAGDWVVVARKAGVSGAQVSRNGTDTFIDDEGATSNLYSLDHANEIRCVWDGSNWTVPYEEAAAGGLPDPAPLLQYTEQVQTVSGGASATTYVDGRHVVLDPDQAHTLTIEFLAGQTAAQAAVLDVYVGEEGETVTFAGGTGVTITNDENADMTLGTTTGKYTRYQFRRIGTSGTVGATRIDTGVAL